MPQARSQASAPHAQDTELWSDVRIVPGEKGDSALARARDHREAQRAQGQAGVEAMKRAGQEDEVEVRHDVRLVERPHVGRRTEAGVWVETAEEYHSRSSKETLLTQVKSQPSPYPNSTI